MNSFVKIENLEKVYPNGVKAVYNFSLDIDKNEFIVLVGPSGCGKSTFLKTLNRMNDLIPGVKITGDVRYREQDIFAPGTDVNELRREIGMVFQKPNPFPMSIYDNIAYGPRTHGIKNRAKLDEIVEKSLRGAAIWDEVKDRLRKNALGLSGGQQQRLCIARALAVEPEVLLMDEPTSALDPISTSKIEELAMQLKEQYTIVIVTHNMQQAVRISDRTAFFLLGKLVEMACKLGRATRPDLHLGICGEHGGDPASVEFCHKVGLDYVSCSPFRVPIARLAAAQAAIKEM